ncbi:MAG: hypothetical protein ACFHVJ_01060 [Aestuariibacter sp.]
MTNPVTNKVWWGNVKFDADEVKVWQIGERKVAIQRRDKQWIVWNKETPEENAAKITVKALKSAQSFTDVPFSRFVFSKTEPLLAVSPALADRPIIARPAAKLNVPPGQQIEVFISTPLWFKASPENHDCLIADLPFWRPSDSWFGPSTMEGEFCYSKFTEARVDLQQLTPLSHRAITPILIRNDYDEALVIERINLPTPYLSLYTDKENKFWSNQIEIVHHNDENKTGLKVKDQAPEQLSNEPLLVAGPRISFHNNHFVRSIKSLLG